ncbi:hypothetical protein Calab_1136 [Caldithrix abyssi DSM 13497]|uniref:Biopolymer transport protein ExbD/TolR n=1 Tax=Caldithrix abyssi DSM 13497 TaxID=880073 RepID=H1XX27_CALAY|nr:hypothetical protein [Caldithrix abyssi]APF20737.1 hypothetical protein Cabys_3992 [Caldithrix abyssi DSM 13497]EHO40764.1 hypothetical protein Calab_1136 [Caldithrix abyssi DSM 13497]
MRRRGKKSTGSFSFNIDSLMDIVTNIVGMLVIIGIISSLSLRSKDFVFETPMVYETEKASIIFECRNNQLFPVSQNAETFYYRTYAAYQEVLIPVPDAQGESIAEISQPGSIFYEMLNQTDPQKQFFYFIVRSDSYDIFREARKLAWEKNIEVGWTPKPKDEIILFSPYGERTKVVD